MTGSVPTDQTSNLLESQARPRSPFVRIAIDAVAAFALFLMATFALGIAPSTAHPTIASSAVSEFRADARSALAEAGDRPIIEIATTSSPANPDALYRRTSISAAWVLLALAFSVVMALNLGMVRHMRQAYVKPRSEPKERRTQ